MLDGFCCVALFWMSAIRLTTTWHKINLLMSGCIWMNGHRWQHFKAELSIAACKGQILESKCELQNTEDSWMLRQHKRTKMHLERDNYTTITNLPSIFGFCICEWVIHEKKVWRAMLCGKHEDFEELDENNASITCRNTMIMSAGSTTSGWRQVCVWERIWWSIKHFANTRNKVFC